MVTSTIDTKLMNYRKISVDWSILGHKFGLSQCFGQRSGNFFPKTIHRKGNCNVWFIKNRTTYKMWLWFVTILWLFWHILIQYCKLLMPRPLKLSILGASCTIILSKDIDKYAFMCDSNFYESDVRNKINWLLHLDLIVCFNYLKSNIMARCQCLFDRNIQY